MSLYESKYIMMKKYFSVFLVFIILMIGSVDNAYTQVIPVTEQQVKRELEDRGIEESVLLQALSEKRNQCDRSQRVKSI